MGIFTPFNLVSNRSRPLASRRKLKWLKSKLLKRSFQSIASPSEQENLLTWCKSLLMKVSNRSRPLASRRINSSFNTSYINVLFPIDRVPQRVGELPPGSMVAGQLQFPIDRVPQRVGDFDQPLLPILIQQQVSNRSRPLASRRVIHLNVNVFTIFSFQSIASPSEQEILLEDLMILSSLVSNRSRPLASRRLVTPNCLPTVLTLFPIDRVPQRVGDLSC